jgi:hypothetical protein
LATAHQADYFANEIQHYDLEDLVPPSAYLLATALDKPVFSTGTGEDWIEVGNHNDVTRVRRWIATATAFGHYFMYSHRKWGFSPETGTRWYTTPIETYKPLTDFISTHPDLFDGFYPLAQVGILYSNEACRGGDWSVREITRSLLDAGVACGFIVQGDEWLVHESTAAALEPFETVVIPSSNPPDYSQTPLIQSRLETGQAVVWDGVESLKASIIPWIAREGPGRLWTLPRTKDDGSGSPLVIHLLNQDYDPTTDSMVANTGSIVSIRQELTGGRVPERIVLHAPGHEPNALKVTSANGVSSVRLPGIELWAVLEVQVR